MPIEGQQRPRTTILIKFAEEVGEVCMYCLKLLVLLHVNDVYVIFLLDSEMNR